MIAGSAVALALRTPNLQPDRMEVVRGFAASGLDIAELESANVDARGSEPWLGATSDGRPVFIKALSPDQRAADLLFRAVRWVRLRRTGDGPPEISLRRAVEHEALVAHHARSLGAATPGVLGVATVGYKKVALAYEGVVGRSLDKVARYAVTDVAIRSVWSQIALLRSHRIAHRDLRLANVFLTDDGDVLLIDFGFAELAASQQLLDTDIAELLAATSTLIGPERAARLAAETLGVGVLEQARDWLHPLAFSTATRHALGTKALETLRRRVDQLTGHTVTDYEPLGRLSASRVLSLVLGAVGVYSLLALVVHEEIADLASGVDGPLVLAAVAVGAVVPLVGALSYRSATGRRTSFRALVPAAFASEAPVAAPTRWSFVNRILSDAAREEGLNAEPAKRAATDRCVAFALAARAVGVDTRPELLIALGIGAVAVASVTPIPARVGAVELLTGAGLLVGNGLAVAALGAIVGRVALFWAPLPLALWAYRSTRHYRVRAQRTRLDDPLARPVSTPTDVAGATTPRSWWT